MARCFLYNIILLLDLNNTKCFMKKSAGRAPDQPIFTQCWTVLFLAFDLKKYEQLTKINLIFSVLPPLPQRSKCILFEPHRPSCQTLT